MNKWFYIIVACCLFILGVFIGTKIFIRDNVTVEVVEVPTYVEQEDTVVEETSEVTDSFNNVPVNPVCEDTTSYDNVDYWSSIDVKYDTRLDLEAYGANFMDNPLSIADASISNFNETHAMFERSGEQPVHLLTEDMQVVNGVITWKVVDYPILGYYDLATLECWHELIEEN